MPNTEANKSLHVAVAVIVKQGKVLISRRAQHVHQGGLWEFPGGKVEADETIKEALYREIKEELGLKIKNSRPLIKLEYHYPDKSVILETQIVTDFEGREYAANASQDEKEPKQFGLEGQQVEWVSFEQLKNFQFPKANKAILDALLFPERYLITPDCSVDNIKQFIQSFANSLGHYEQSQQIVQIRIKSLKGEILSKLIQQLGLTARAKNTLILANSSMCLESSSVQASQHHLNILNLTDGIHLTGEHLYGAFIKKYRQQFPEKKIAASCHCQKDIEQANHSGLDFIVVSPVQHTASHPETEPLGWKQFRRLADIAEMPVFALGGMSQNDIKYAQDNGAQGISAIRGLWNNSINSKSG